MLTLYQTLDLQTFFSFSRLSFYFVVHFFGCIAFLVCCSNTPWDCKRVGHDIATKNNDQKTNKQTKTDKTTKYFFFFVKSNTFCLFLLLLLAFLVSYLKSYCWNQCQGTFCLCSSRSFMISGLTFKSFILCSLIFAYDLGDSSSILWDRIFSFLITIYWRDCFLLWES